VVCDSEYLKLSTEAACGYSAPVIVLNDGRSHSLLTAKAGSLLLALVHVKLRRRVGHEIVKEKKEKEEDLCNAVADIRPTPGTLAAPRRPSAALDETGVLRWWPAGEHRRASEWPPSVQPRHRRGGRPRTHLGLGARQRQACRAGGATAEATRSTGASRQSRPRPTTTTTPPPLTRRATEAEGARPARAAASPAGRSATA
jgi:hypothetical protein